MAWACTCGGDEASQEGGKLCCSACNESHHVMCCFDLLRGTCRVAKFAFLKPSSFECPNCAPTKYSWVFQCSCLRGGGAAIYDFDDGKDMVECIVCRRWSHLACNYSINIPATCLPAARVEGTAEVPVCKLCQLSTSDDQAHRNTALEEDLEWFHFEPQEDACSEQLSSLTRKIIDEQTRSAPPSECDMAGLLGGRLVRIDRTADQVYTSSQSQKGGEESTHLVRPPRLKGLHLRSKRFRDEKIVDEVVVRGCYERPRFDFEILPGDIWLDLGAHIGVFTSLCLAAGAHVVISFKPLGRKGKDFYD